MQRKRVLIVGWKRPLPAKAKALGVEVWYAQRACLYQPNVADVCDMIVLCDYTDQDTFVDLVADLHRVRPFDAVVAIAEDALLSAAAVVDRLGLRGPSAATVRLLTDKWSMRRRLAEAGVSPVAAAIGSGVDDLRAFGESAGYPFIAKPIAGAGSFGVSKVEGVGDVERAYERLGGATRFLMEEFLVGPEISVESFSFGGEHVVLSLTDKLVGGHFIEAGHQVPAAVDPVVHDQVVDLVHRFLDAVGLADGPSHVEVKLTPAGPRVVEGHNRRGGDRINELVEAAYGIDMETLTVGWALGLVEPLTESPTPIQGAAIRFLSAEPGEVVEVRGAENPPLPGVESVQVSVSAGGRVNPPEWSDDRPGYVIAVGETAAAAARTCEEAAARIMIVTRPGDAGPATARGVDQSALLGY
ncbi:Biotin carboxylase [Actinokineospora alba]|uniref:Biotin carboxylase n=2 Tax=Actinokineospora alba TaxID=504798 RepID=A0A1H0NJF8_9PSEU|nr:biotin carboxylase [Actinokineospora alba]SDH85477.1 Biotin carboxylase [Actinokineospora alba]SDO92555.1 Biotin carboxylase [Actinokineospora alba]